MFFCTRFSIHSQKIWNIFDKNQKVFLIEFVITVKAAKIFRKLKTKPTFFYFNSVFIQILTHKNNL